LRKRATPNLIAVMIGVDFRDFTFEPRLRVCLSCGGSVVPAPASVAGDYAVAGFTHDRCEACGTIFANPRPDKPSLAHFYSQIGARDDARLAAAGLRYYQDPERRKSRTADYLAPLLKHRTAGRLLDFGCGSGWFVAMARDAGFDAHGIELIPDNVAAARDVLKLDTVIEGDETALPLEPAFDIIVCNNLIEHLSDPFAFAGQVRRALRPGGLWMLNFPSVDGAMFRAFREHSYYFMTPYHLTHFTRAGISALLQRAGFGALSFDIQREAFYWGRGLASKLGMPDSYERWREDPNFVRYDIALDELLSDLALRIGPALNEIVFAGTT
jgi:SAM-dependent methyltransferase